MSVTDDHIAAVIEQALVDASAGLAPDGFRLTLRSISGAGDVEVDLEALPGACIECLVPNAILVGILEASVEKHCGEPRHVMLRKVNFE